MAQAGTVWVDVRGNTAPLTRDIGKAAAAASALAIAGLGVAAVRESTQFNKAISGVGAVANATAADLENLRKAALQAGADTAFSASEAATAEAELAKAGLSTADILGGALSGSLDLAAAGQLALGDAATITAQALNTFNLNGSDTSHVADVLAAGANKSAADVSQLGQALAQGGLVAKQTGLSLEDTVGVLSLFADNALVGSDAGTSLKTALQRLVPQSTEAAGAMKDLGLSFFDAQGNFVGVEATAQKLQDALRGLSTEQRQTALTTIFGADAIRAAGLLYEAGGAGVRDYTTAVNDVGAANRMASIQLDNLSGDLETLKGSWETVLIGLGSSADSGLRDIVQALTEGVNTVGEFVQSPVFNQVTEAVGGALGDLADGLGDAGEGLESFLGRLDTDEVSGFFDALRDGAEGLEGPLAGVAAALSTLSLAKLSGGLIPGLSPLQGVLAGIVLQSEEGREALGSMFDVAMDAAEAFTPILGVAADALGLLAEQGWLVEAALDVFLATKIVSGITPMIGAVKGLAGGFTFLKGEIASIAATKGVSQLEALRGVVGSSNSGLTGALGGLNIATIGLTAGIAGGLYLYQEWADGQKEVEDRARSLTEALLEQNDVNASTQLGRILRELRDESGDLDTALTTVFDQTGQSVASVSDLIQENVGAVGALNKELEQTGRVVPTKEQLAGLPDGIRPFVESLVDMVEAGDLSGPAFQELFRALVKVDDAASTSAENIGKRAARMAEEAKKVNLSTEAEKQLNIALNDNSSLEARRDALDELTRLHPELAEAAGYAATETEKVDAASAGAASSINAAGSAADGAAGSLSALGEGAGTAADGLLDLLDAQDSAEDGAQRVADAQEKLTEILSGNTEGVRDARDALREAQEALADARSEVGPGSKASRDAARDLRDARKALRDAQIEAGKEPEEGDFYEDKQDAILDAIERIAEAEQKLAEINSGTSDQVVSAQDRVADAQERLGEELAKTGPASREARDAQEELDDAQRNAARSAEGFNTALGESTGTTIPAQIAALDELRKKYGLNKDEVDQLIGSLLIKAALEQGAATAGTPAPVSSVGPTARPGFKNAETTQQTGPTAGSVTERERIPAYQTGPGRAYGGDVWAGTIHPVNELGEPEMFEDRSGGQFLLPTQSGTVTPMGDVVGAIQAMHRDFLRTAPTSPDGSELAALLQENNRLLRELAAGNQRSAADVRRGAVAFA